MKTQTETCPRLMSMAHELREMAAEWDADGSAVSSLLHGAANELAKLSGVVVFREQVLEKVVK